MGRYHPGAFIVYPHDTIYFVTFTVIDWVDVFTREEYKRIIAESLDFCRRDKGLQIFAWVLMTNHIHLIVAHDIDNDHLWKVVIGDFKKFTSKKVIKAIIDNPKESRKKWMLEHFSEENILKNEDASCSVSKSRKGSDHSGSSHYHLWQRGFDRYCIYNVRHMHQKMDYLHENPVRAGIVVNPGEYKYSSYPNYSGDKGLIEIDSIDLGLSDPTRPSRW